MCIYYFILLFLQYITYYILLLINYLSANLCMHAYLIYVMYTNNCYSFLLCTPFICTYIVMYSFYILLFTLIIRSYHTFTLYTTITVIIIYIKASSLLIYTSCSSSLCDSSMLPTSAWALLLTLPLTVR